jgi:hypothetical protein
MSLSQKVQIVRDSAEADLSVFIKLMAPHLLIGGIHQELIQWWTRSEAKKN